MQLFFTKENFQKMYSCTRKSQDSEHVLINHFTKIVLGLFSLKGFIRL